MQFFLLTVSDAGEPEITPIKKVETATIGAMKYYLVPMFQEAAPKPRVSVAAPKRSHHGGWSPKNQSDIEIIENAILDGGDNGVSPLKLKTLLSNSSHLGMIISALSRKGVIKRLSNGNWSVA